MPSTKHWSPRWALGTAATVGLVVLVVAAGAGQPPAQPAREAPPGGNVEPPLFNPGRADDEKAIRAADAEFVRAFNANEAEPLAALFTDDAQIVDEHGQTFVGREAIRKRFAQSFKNPGGAVLSIRVDTIRFLGPDLALERGIATIGPAEPPDAPGETGPYTVVHVKRGGKWLQASVEDHSPAPPVEPETNTERLKELEWLLGDWVNESPAAVVMTSCRWDESKNFLLQQYTIQTAGKPVIRGTQRIGWDPARKRVRSWSFDSDGGFGEGFWSRDAEGRWVVRASGTRRDGQTVESTRVITPLDSHRIRWESVFRSQEGEALPDVDAFVMVRKPPPPSAAAPAAAKPATQGR
jgi:uncharacterized protein (TIGR02246 family)